MTIVLKILAAPLIALLTVSWALLVFVFALATKILNYLSGLAGLAAIIFFIAGQTTNGIVFAIVSLLISPVGIPAIAGWLIDKLDDLNYTLKCFIMT